MRKGGLREYQIPLKVGQPEYVPAKGNYLRIRAALADLLVEIGDNDIYKMSAGEDIAYAVDEEFTRIRVTSLAAADETISIQVGSNVRVTSSKLNGSVSISGNANFVQVGSVNNANVVTDYTGAVQYRSIVPLAAGTAEEIVNPAANVNGLIVLSAEFQSAYAALPASPDFNLIAHTGVPTVAQGLSISFDEIIIGTANAQRNLKTMNRPVFIQAGMGLYAIDGPVQQGGKRNVIYKLL